MKRKSRKSRPSKKNKARRSTDIKLQRTKTRKRRSTFKKVCRYLTLKSERQTLTHQKALRALRLMREEKLSLSAATRREHIKPNTFLRHVGSAVHRSGPGKPWKASKSDSLSARMRILTPKGPVFDVVRGSREDSTSTLRDRAQEIPCRGRWRREGTSRVSGTNRWRPRFGNGRKPVDSTRRSRAARFR